MILQAIGIILLVIILCILANRLYFSGAKYYSTKSLKGKTTIITGANTGIGYETALDFAKRGAKVILACRDAKRAEKAAESIVDLTKNKDVEFEYLDLADLETVRDFAKKMNSKLDKLDILVNNAGIMTCPYWKTKQGFEMQFGVNHLGHFLLTNLLLELIKKSQDGRIITVSSLAHAHAKINWDDINGEKSYNTMKAYGQSKLANVLFTKELARRLEGTNITAVSLHPGVVRTELARYTGESFGRLIPYLYKKLLFIIAIISKSSYEGAMTTIYCALDDSVPKYKGYYFSDCKPKKPGKPGLNRDDAARLWEVSSKMVNL